MFSIFTQKVVSDLFPCLSFLAMIRKGSINLTMKETGLTFTFSHLADTLFQSDLQ